MNRKAIFIFVLMAAMVVALSGCKGKPASTAAAGPATGADGGPRGTTPPAGFKLVDASGFKVADYKGQVLLMDFWATWCGPCKMEIPHLIELQDKYRDRGLVVVGITMDDNAEEAVPKYAAEVGMNYANVKGTDALKTEYGIIGLPTIVIFDRNGNKVFNRPGYVEKAELEAQLQPLLGPATSP